MLEALSLDPKPKIKITHQKPNEDNVPCKYAFLGFKILHKNEHKSNSRRF